MNKRRDYFGVQVVCMWVVCVSVILLAMSGCFTTADDRWPFIGVDELPEGGLVWVLDGAVAGEMRSALEAVVPVYGVGVLEHMRVVDGRVYADDLAVRVWMRGKGEGRGEREETDRDWEVLR